jgi:4-hydroxy-tetrahydrodipicolinate synthase
MKLKGVYTALVTPFSGKMLDESGFERLVEWQISQGVDGLVPCGTTGEASTLSYEEHERVIELAVKIARKRVSVLAGTGSNSTNETIELTRAAKDLGADGALIVAPYYNRPSQEGLYRHFKAVAESIDLPIVLYNIPTRTGVNMLPDLVARLAAIPTIVGIKEASGSLQQVADIFRLTKGEFSIISGDDNLFLPMMSVGARGVISVVSNVLPSRMKALAEAFMTEGDPEKARDIHMELSPLFQTLFIEVNPVPVKESLYYMGMIEDKTVRLPLCPLADSSRTALLGVLKSFGLVSSKFL